ncbi:MAG: HNH endonuclease signature motif containing protein [Anaerolineae bacterium]
MCQVCQTTKATEVHHVCYPPWGEFDVIENLLPICHNCHSVIHDKES